MAQRKKSLLIVEDDIHVALAYQIKLEKEAPHIKVSVVHDGAKAITFLREHARPSAIILDRLLPEQDGLEVLRTIKKNEAWRTIPVIIISNLGQEKDMKLAKRLGAVDYLVKAKMSIHDVVTRIQQLPPFQNH